MRASRAAGDAWAVLRGLSSRTTRGPPPGATPAATASRRYSRFLTLRATSSGNRSLSKAGSLLFAGLPHIASLQAHPGRARSFSGQGIQTLSLAALGSPSPIQLPLRGTIGRTAFGASLTAARRPAGRQGMAGMVQPKNKKGEQHA